MLERRIISIHALREEGDGSAGESQEGCRISIHALREEGDDPDRRTHTRPCNFYPRPPRGGRPATVYPLHYCIIFLSTPSARRATGAQTPRSTGSVISIHALREEGDKPAFTTAALFAVISIHALREEGDVLSGLDVGKAPDFYPRPPRGGRLVTRVKVIGLEKFLSTPSARRATPGRGNPRPAEKISIHALREEGDPRSIFPASITTPFLSTPSARRATAGDLFRRYQKDNFYPRPPRGGRPACIIFSFPS